MRLSIEKKRVELKGGGFFRTLDNVKMVIMK